MPGNTEEEFVDIEPLAHSCGCLAHDGSGAEHDPCPHCVAWSETWRASDGFKAAMRDFDLISFSLLGAPGCLTLAYADALRMDRINRTVNHYGGWSTRGTFDALWDKFKRLLTAHRDFREPAWWVHEAKVDHDRGFSWLMDELIECDREAWMLLVLDANVRDDFIKSYQPQAAFKLHFPYFTRSEALQLLASSRPPLREAGLQIMNHLGRPKADEVGS